MAQRSADWLRQAQRDLEHARHDASDGYYEWGCFSAQQAAEKAVKALYQHLGGEAWGHALKRLLEELPPEVGVTPQLMDAGRILDRFYIPTRYPNGFDDGIPAEYYTAADCDTAIGCAEAIVRFCADRLSR
ncbi:MAG: HEPN domain-containing protein [Anaerolineae bacterium]